MSNSGSVAVIGAGWYGCHIALELVRSGVDVVVFESEGQIFSKASGNNQYRLHQGFHYPRSKATRRQSKDGFERFIERYPDFSNPTKGRNLYLVPHRDSLLDFDTYLDVMSSTSLSFDQIGTIPEVKGIEGAIVVQERVIQTGRAAEYFAAELGSKIRTGVPVGAITGPPGRLEVGGEVFDWVVDATWGHLTPTKGVLYEPTMLLYLEGKGWEDAITLVDGDLWSLYPVGSNGIFTLSHVVHTKLGSFTSADEARFALSSLSGDYLMSRAKKMLQEVARWFPAVLDMTLVDFQLSVKTKKAGLSEGRVAESKLAGNRFEVFSGKIDAVFEVADAIKHAVLVGPTPSKSSGSRTLAR